MLAIGPYLHRRWGDAVLQCFYTHEQTTIKATKWDENNNPILVIDSTMATPEDDMIEDWMTEPTPGDNIPFLSRPSPNKEDSREEERGETLGSVILEAQ